MLVFSAAMGWCGTPYPWWWWFKHWPPPPPPPDWAEWLNQLKGDPQPQPWLIGLGVVGGLIGGFAANATLGGEQFSTIGLAAFAGGRILSRIGLPAIGKMR